MAKIQYTRARALVEKMDSVVMSNQTLRDALSVDGVDGWQLYRQRVFGITKEWSKDPQNFKESKEIFGVKAYLLHFWFLLVSVWAAYKAKKRGVTALVYTTDKISSDTPVVCDGRIKELYQVLVDKKTSFLEIVHGTYSRNTFSNAKKRGRSVMYYEVLGGLPNRRAVTVPHYDSSVFKEDEIRCVRYIFRMVLRSLTQSQRVIKRTKKLCRYLGITHVYGIDDARYVYEVVHGAHKTGVKTALVQHGHITKYHLGWLSYGETPYIQVAPQQYIVWSAYWKRELQRLQSHMPTESVLVARRKSAESDKNIELKEGDLQVVFPYETDAPKDEIVLAIKGACACGMFDVIFKARKDMGVSLQLQEYGLDGFQHERFSVSVDLIPKPNMLIVGTYSTYLYDMIERMVPVAYLQTSLDFGIGLVENDLADRLVPGYMFCSDIESAYSHALTRCALRKEKLVDTTMPLLHDIL